MDARHLPPGVGALRDAGPALGTTEAKNIETREGRQNAIAEANAIGNRIAQDAKDAKAAMKAEKQEKVALEMQKIPKSWGVGWHKKRGKWNVMCRLDGKKIHGGYFVEHREAVAKVQELRSMANSQ
jgi:hypothetical protein